MRFVLGFVSGVAAAWAALAIWQRVPPLGPVDASDEEAWAAAELFEPFWEPRRGDRRPDFDGSAIGGSAVPDIHLDGCRYPARPCVCGVFVAIHGGIGAP